MPNNLVSEKPVELGKLIQVAYLVVILSAFAWAKEFLLPLILAILISFLLAPVVSRLGRWRFPRAVAVLSVVAIVFALIGCLCSTLSLEGLDLVNSLPKYRDNIHARWAAIQQGPPGPLNLALRAKVLGSITSARLPIARSQLASPRSRTRSCNRSQTLMSGYNFSIICRTSSLLFSELLLKPSKQFIFFTFRKHQIIIGKISVLLFKLALMLRRSSKLEAQSFSSRRELCPKVSRLHKLLNFFLKPITLVPR